MKTSVLLSVIRNQKGATAVLIAILLVVFIGFIALPIDLSNIFLAHNELQNAADAGALAGARFLYNDEGTAVNINANQLAYDAAFDNVSQNDPVEVNWSGGNAGDVQRGHWRFATKTFTANDSTAAVDLWNATTEELDANLNFINAVRVFTRRETTPVVSYFARIFNIDSFQKSASAVAYIGFSGTLAPWEADQPIAICKQSLLLNGEYVCNVGRMINSGQDDLSSETGGWTDFNQDNPCSGGTDANTMKQLVCGDGNPGLITLGGDIATNGGQIQSAFDVLYDCWENASADKTKAWNLTLVVITCPGNNVSTCEEVVGAVNLNVVWVTGSGTDPHYNNAPTQMENWSNDDPEGQVRWESFVTEFNLQNVDGSPAPYDNKSIYFLPDCSYHEPKGGTGGENFGVLARIPVLVK